MEQTCITSFFARMSTPGTHSITAAQASGNRIWLTETWETLPWKPTPGKQELMESDSNWSPVCGEVEALGLGFCLTQFYKRCQFSIKLMESAFELLTQEWPRFTHCLSCWQVGLGRPISLTTWPILVCEIIIGGTSTSPAMSSCRATDAVNWFTSMTHIACSLWFFSCQTSPSFGVRLPRRERGLAVPVGKDSTRGCVKYSCCT